MRRCRSSLLLARQGSPELGQDMTSRSTVRPNNFSRAVGSRWDRQHCSGTPGTSECPQEIRTSAEMMIVQAKGCCKQSQAGKLAGNLVSPHFLHRDIRAAHWSETVLSHFSRTHSFVAPQITSSAKDGSYAGGGGECCISR